MLGDVVLETRTKGASPKAVSIINAPTSTTSAFQRSAPPSSLLFSMDSARSMPQVEKRKHTEVKEHVVQHRRALPTCCPGCEFLSQGQQEWEPLTQDRLFPPVCSAPALTPRGGFWAYGSFHLMQTGDENRLGK